MKSLILALSLAVFSAGMAPSASEAKRLGGGGSSGMQRSTPPRSTPDAAPAKPAQAAPAAAATPAAGAAPKRSWMGPLAGLAAGLGIAALMSHFGLGAEKQADSVEVQWPDGTTTKMENVKANRLLEIVQGR